MTAKNEIVISEQQAQEIVESMGRREPHYRKSTSEFYHRIVLELGGLEQAKKSGTMKAEQVVTEGQANAITETMLVWHKRVSNKHWKLLMNAHRITYMQDCISLKHCNIAFEALGKSRVTQDAICIQYIINLQSRLILEFLNVNMNN